jgi:hypothetical protein
MGVDGSDYAMIWRWLGLLIVAAVFIGAVGIGAPPQVNPPFCPYGSALADGCIGAQGHGTIVDAHMADPKAVIDLVINGGSGYTNGTYSWTSSGGGCTTNASGTITVSGGKLGGATRGTPANFAITTRGAGCTSRPTISVPGGAGAGTSGTITPVVYQLTPHNAAATIGNNWNVVGVDYPVGYDTTLTLADPTGAGLPSCASFSGSTVTINSSNCTINGFDFSLHTTNLIVAGGLTGIVITNNKFQCVHGVTTALQLLQISGGTTNTTIKYNTFDGGAVIGLGCNDTGPNSGAVAAIGSYATGGTVTVEYNYCFHEDSKCLNFGGSASSSSTTTVVEQYNVWADFGSCGGDCSHGEAEYAFSSTSLGANVVLTWSMQFNVMLIHYYAGPTSDTSAASVEADGTTINTPNIQYNYELARGDQAYTGSNNSNAEVASASMFCGAQESGSYTGTKTQANNILDYSGAFFPYNSGGSPNCATSFPSLADFNAGTGNSCNVSTCN